MSLFKKLFLSKINVKKYHINEDEIRKLSSLILKEEYKNFENYIFLFYNDNEKYEKKISENTDIWNSDNEQKSIYQAMKSFALYNKKAVFYYKEDIFQNNLEWNKVGEVFDFLFEDVLDNEIILERKSNLKTNWQTPKEVVKYVRENLEKIGKINIFEIYK